MNPVNEKPKAIICDLDGTLCDTRWREHFVTGKVKNWKAFYAGIPADPVHHFVLALLLELWSETDATILFITGRELSHLGKTKRWITTNTPFGLDGIRDAKLMMRPNGDYRPDLEVKKELFEEAMRDYDIIKAYEDRPHIVALLQEMGISTTHVVQNEE